MVNYVEGASIMAVDDEPDNLRLLAAILRGEGALVRAATSGEIAIDSMRKFPPDLVLLDIGLPNIDGFEVAERMKYHSELREIPVVFLSGRTALADKIEAFSVGAVDYIEKPFQTAEVLARVRTHLDLTRRRREEGRRAAMLEVLLKERELLLSERERFTAMIVHDMRSPLQVIAGYLDLAELGPTSKDHLKSAVNSCEALGIMTTDALEMSRISTGAMPLDETRIKAADITEDAMRLLHTTPPPEVGSVEGVVYCDHYLITRVLLNLLSNAVEHGEGPITVSSAPEGNMVKFEVADSGPGIAAAETETIFHPFVSGTTRVSTATRGLGLAFCRAAIVAHGGRLGVHDGPNGGAVFWFTLHQGDAKQSS